MVEPTRLAKWCFAPTHLSKGKRYSFRICYRILGEGTLVATVSRNGEAIIVNMPLPPQGPAWANTTFRCR